MSMKSNFMAAAAMAMMAAQSPNLFDGGYYPTEKNKPAPRKNEQKKCKSCKHFQKGSYKGSCPWRRIVDPLAAACQEHYQKRKK
jgi:hypothetical protein